MFNSIYLFLLPYWIFKEEVLYILGCSLVFFCFFKAQPWNGSFLDEATESLPSCVTPAFQAKCEGWTPVTAHFFRAKS